MENIADDKLQVLKKSFNMVDTEKTGIIETTKIRGILNTLDIRFKEEEITKNINEIDADKTGKVNFDSFMQIVSVFIVDDDEDEPMYEELKEAFRLYDTSGNGYITTETLGEILKELDNKLTQEDLLGIIEEIDEDGSGTVDFDEFMEMMTG